MTCTELLLAYWDKVLSIVMSAGALTFSIIIFKISNRRLAPALGLQIHVGQISGKTIEINFVISNLSATPTAIVRHQTSLQARDKHGDWVLVTTTPLNDQIELPINIDGNSTSRIKKVFRRADDHPEQLDHLFARFQVEDIRGRIWEACESVMSRAVESCDL